MVDEEDLRNLAVSLGWAEKRRNSECLVFVRRHGLDTQIFECWIPNGTVSVVVPHHRHQVYRKFYFGLLENSEQLCELLEDPWGYSNEDSYTSSNGAQTSHFIAGSSGKDPEDKLMLADGGSGVHRAANSTMDNASATQSFSGNLKNAMKASDLKEALEQQLLVMQREAIMLENDQIKIRERISTSLARSLQREKGNHLIWKLENLSFERNDENMSSTAAGYELSLEMNTIWESKREVIDHVALCDNGFAVVLNNGQVICCNLPKLLQSKIQPFSSFKNKNDQAMPLKDQDAQRNCEYDRRTDGSRGPESRAPRRQGSRYREGQRSRSREHSGPLKVKYVVGGSDGIYYVKFNDGRMEWCGQDLFGETLRNGVTERLLQVDSVAFGENGSWFVLWNDQSFDAYKLPGSLAQKLQVFSLDSGVNSQSTMFMNRSPNLSANMNALNNHIAAKSNAPNQLACSQNIVSQTALSQTSMSGSGLPGSVGISQGSGHLPPRGIQSSGWLPSSNNCIGIATEATTRPLPLTPNSGSDFLSGYAPNVKDLTMGPSGEWFIIYKDHSVQADNLPDSLYDVLSNLRNQSARVRRITFGSNKSWIVRYYQPSCLP